MKDRRHYQRRRQSDIHPRRRRTDRAWYRLLPFVGWAILTLGMMGALYAQQQNSRADLSASIYAVCNAHKVQVERLRDGTEAVLSTVIDSLARDSNADADLARQLAAARIAIERAPVVDCEAQRREGIPGRD